MAKAPKEILNTAALMASTEASRVASGSGKAATMNDNEYLRELEKLRKVLTQYYINEPKVVVTVSPFYRPHFGKRMPVILNQIPIYVPVDGRQYEIPESYAMVVNERIARVDRLTRQQDAMANVSENFEQFPGEKKFINAL